MNNKICFITQNNSETAQLLATKLNCNIVKKETDIPIETELLVCYGYWKSLTPNILERTDNGLKILNYPDAVKLCSNKIASLVKLRENGINTPKFWNGITPEFPCVARTTNHHSGSGFWLCINKREYNNAVMEGATHSLQYIPNNKEYRVYVFQNEVIETKQKIVDDNFDGEIDYNVRSVHKGWKFITTNNFPQEQKELCIKAVKSLGLDFGAVDVILSDNGEYFIIEVNSSAGMSIENVTNKFCAKIESLIPKEKTYTEQDIVTAIDKVLRHTRLFNKPYVITYELLEALGVKL